MTVLFSCFVNPSKKIIKLSLNVISLLRLPFSSPNTMWLIFFSRKFVKITWKLIDAFVHISVMYNSYYFYWFNAKYENRWGNYVHMNVWFFLISTSVGIFSKFYGLPHIFSLENARLTSEAFAKLKKTISLTLIFLGTTSRIQSN